MDEVCPFIKEWRTKQLLLRKYGYYIDFNQLPTIPKKIKEIKFPNLQNIGLGENLIESVEGLSQIHLPNLKWLGKGKFANIQWATISALSLI